MLVERHPNFFAIAQVQRHLRGYRTFEREAAGDRALRVYRVGKDGSTEVWIAWLDPGVLWLPGDVVPTREYELILGGTATSATIEKLVTDAKRSEPARETVTLQKGRLQLKLTPVPVFVWRTR